MINSVRISSGAISDRGLSEKRPQNEDSYLDMEQCGIYAVADGVGGAQAGEVASQMAVEILAEAFMNFPDGADAESVMRSAIERANEAIFEMASELPQLANMATTIVALHLDGDIATIGHVGDSRLYRVESDGNLYRETDDHSMVAEEVRAGRMTEEQADNHPSRNIISRALGAEPTVEVDLKTMMVEPGTAFLLCSDGITRHVGDPEIKGVLTFGGDPAEICEYLKGLCYDRGAEDNLTAVVVKISADDRVADLPDIAAEQDSEEPTISTARPLPEPTTSDDDDDGLLELETRELKMPEPATQAIALGEKTLSWDEQDTVESDEETLSIGPTPTGQTHSEAETIGESAPALSNMFSPTDDFAPAVYAEDKPSLIGRIAVGVALLFLGGIIGLGLYHFAFAPAPSDVVVTPMSEMKSENIDFTSFEKNRRNVDADPAAYLRELPPPDDAEDFYLVGRAYMLTGQFPAARAAFIEAQKRSGDANIANARTLRTDIAIALLITNDPTIQNRLRTEIDGAVTSPVNSNVNPN